jgi:hypothetical protein
MADLRQELERLEREIEETLIREAEERGYRKAKEEFVKFALSCCCSGCTKHNMFLIGELNDGQMQNLHEQLAQETPSPHGENEV